jgi:hypothetical protein
MYMHDEIRYTQCRWDAAAAGWVYQQMSENVIAARAVANLHNPPRSCLFYWREFTFKLNGDEQQSAYKLITPEKRRNRELRIVISNFTCRRGTKKITFFTETCLSSACFQSIYAPGFPFFAWFMCRNGAYLIHACPEVEQFVCAKWAARPPGRQLFEFRADPPWHMEETFLGHANLMRSSSWLIK